MMNDCVPQCCNCNLCRRYQVIGQFVDEYDLLCEKHICILQEEDSELTYVQAIALLDLATRS